MADLIDRQAAIDAINSVFPLKNFSDLDIIGMTRTAQIWECAEAIEKLPAIDAEPVRHGRWMDGHRAGYELSLYWFIYCSECLYERDDDDHDKDTPFCPHCGARMDKEEHDER